MLYKGDKTNSPSGTSQRDVWERRGAVGGCMEVAVCPSCKAPWKASFPWLLPLSARHRSLSTDSRFSRGSTFEPRSHIPSATTWSGRTTLNQSGFLWLFASMVPALQPTLPGWSFSTLPSSITCKPSSLPRLFPPFIRGKLCLDHEDFISSPSRIFSCFTSLAMFCHVCPGGASFCLDLITCPRFLSSGSFSSLAITSFS